MTCPLCNYCLRFDITNWHLDASKLIQINSPRHKIFLGRKSCPATKEILFDVNFHGEIGPELIGLTYRQIKNIYQQQLVTFCNGNRDK